MIQPEGGGEAQEWSIEATSPGVLTRSGWTRNAVKPGDRVSVEFNPLRDGFSWRAPAIHHLARYRPEIAGRQHFRFRKVRFEIGGLIRLGRGASTQPPAGYWVISMTALLLSSLK